MTRDRKLFFFALGMGAGALLRDLGYFMAERIGC